jgi:hypothetical protein
MRREQSLPDLRVHFCFGQFGEPPYKLKPLRP